MQEALISTGIVGVIYGLLMIQLHHWRRVAGVERSLPVVVDFFIYVGVIFIPVVSIYLGGGAIGYILLFAIAWLASIAIIDAWTGYIPDTFTYPFALIGVVLNVTQFGQFNLGVESIFAALFGFGLFLGADYVHYKVKNAHGLGLGDAKLFASILAWTGFASSIAILLIASLSSLLFVGAYSLWQKTIQKQDQQSQRDLKNSTFPFGPHLVIGAFAYLCFSYNTFIQYLFYSVLSLFD